MALGIDKRASIVRNRYYGPRSPAQWLVVHRHGHIFIWSWCLPSPYDTVVEVGATYEGPLCLWSSIAVRLRI